MIATRFLAVVFALLFSIAPSFAGETPSAAAVASAHPLATEAGIEILKQGGNAFDAAVAISAALAVVEPNSSGIGGGGFWLLHRAADGRETMVDAREKAPGAAYRRMYLDKDDNPIPGASINGPLAAGIPGLVAGLAWLTDQYGTLPLKVTLAPAIRYAREGFAVTPGYQRVAGFRAEVLNKDPSAAAIFLKDGKPPEIGDRVVQKDLAKLFEKIGELGPGYFYRGRFAEDMVQGVRAAGGIWSADDLANYRVTERRPIVAQYRDLRIVSAPPPSSGGIVLAQAFAILSEFDLNAMDDVTRMHYIIEAMRRAYRDRAVYLGDPDFVKIRTDRLLDHDYLAGLAMSIEPDKATPSAELSDTPGYDPAGNQTTHFSVIDTQGNRIAGTLSINLPFGAGFVPPGTGVLLNDEMDDFSIKPNTANAYGLIGFDANAIEPNKRPLSSMSPTFVETADRVGILGTPGGSRIISMVMLGILDFEQGHLPQSWVEQRRYHHQYLPDEVQYEKGGLTDFEKQKLEAMGYTLKEASYRYGDMHAVLWDKAADKVYAASDPRGEGKAEVLEGR